MKNKIISWALALALCSALVMSLVFAAPYGAAAAAAPSEWAAAEVTEAIARGLVPAELQSSYTEYMTRAEFCKTAITFIEAVSGNAAEEVLSARGLTVDKKAFSDTADPDILAASALGIVNGKGDGKFDPQGSITRQEAATMLSRVVTALELDRLSPAAGSKYFTDSYEIADWANAGVNFILSCAIPDTETAVMNGVGNRRFSPKGTYTREQSFITMLRLMKATHYVDGRRALALDIAPTAQNSDTGSIYYKSKPEDIYLFSRAAGYTVLYKQTDGTLSVRELDKGFHVTRQLTLAKELDVFGDAHMSKDGSFYVMTGQHNTEESVNKEVIRVVKYDSGWNRRSAASVRAGKSIIRIPFDAGNPQMDSSGSDLIIYTSRERFTTGDGLNHQSNLTIRINTDTMSVEYQSPSFDINHVSHSFRQFVKYDGGKLVYVDHGDAYPRSIVLQTETPSAKVRNLPTANLLNARGNTGDNYTGMAPGGFELTAGNYMVAAATIDQSSSATQKVHNIVLLTVPRNNVSDANVQSRALTNLPASGDVTAGVPYLVHITNDRLAVIWSEFKTDLGGFIGTKHVVVDGSGRSVSDVKTSYLPTSQYTQPIYEGGKIYWVYVGDVAGPIEADARYAAYLCTLDLREPGVDLTAVGREVIDEKDNTEEEEDEEKEKEDNEEAISPTPTEPETTAPAETPTPEPADDRVYRLPYVIGLWPDSAELLLTAAGFAVGETRYCRIEFEPHIDYIWHIPIGDVTVGKIFGISVMGSGESWNTNDATMEQPGAVLRLYINNGHFEPVDRELVLGDTVSPLMGTTEQEAAQYLRSIGLEAEIEYRPDYNFVNGKVVAVDFSSDCQLQIDGKWYVDKGTAIHLWIGS
jgi:hypothetical protein